MRGDLVLEYTHCTLGPLLLGTSGTESEINQTKTKGVENCTFFEPKVKMRFKGVFDGSKLQFTSKEMRKSVEFILTEQHWKHRTRLGERGLDGVTRIRIPCRSLWKHCAFLG